MTSCYNLKIIIIRNNFSYKTKIEKYTCCGAENTLILFETACWLLVQVIVEAFVMVVVFTFDFGAEVEVTVTIWGFFEESVVVVDITDVTTVEDAKLLAAVVGTSLIYCT